MQQSFYLDYLKFQWLKTVDILELIFLQRTVIDVVNGCHENQINKTYANANLLLRMLSSCSVSVKCYLFMTYCSTLYCALCCSTAPKRFGNVLCRI